MAKNWTCSFWSCHQPANLYNCRVRVDISRSNFDAFYCSMGFRKICNCSLFPIWTGSFKLSDVSLQPFSFDYLFRISVSCLLLDPSWWCIWTANDKKSWGNVDELVVYFLVSWLLMHFSFLAYYRVVLLVVNGLSCTNAENYHKTYMRCLLG